MSRAKLSAVMLLAVSILFCAAVAVAVSSTPPSSSSASLVAWRAPSANDSNPPASPTTPAAWSAFGGDDSSASPATAASTATAPCRVFLAADINSEHHPAAASTCPDAMFGASDITGKLVDVTRASPTAYAVHIAKGIDYDHDDFAGPAISATPLTTSPTASDPHQFNSNRLSIPAASGSPSISTDFIATSTTGTISDRGAALRPLARRLLLPRRGLVTPVQVQGCDALRLAKLVINSCNIRGRGHDCCDAVIAVIGRGQTCFCAVSWEAYYRQSAPEGGKGMLVIFSRCTEGREPYVQDNCKRAASLPTGNIGHAPLPSHATSPAAARSTATTQSTAAPPTAFVAAAAQSCLPITRPDWISRTLAIVFAAALCVCLGCLWVQNYPSSPAAWNYDSSDSSNSVSSVHSEANISESVTQQCTQPRLTPAASHEDNSDCTSSGKLLLAPAAPAAPPAAPDASSIGKSSVELVAFPPQPQTPLFDGSSSGKPFLAPTCNLQAPDATSVDESSLPFVADDDESNGGNFSGNLLLPPPAKIRQSSRIKRAIIRWMFDEGV